MVTINTNSTIRVSASSDGTPGNDHTYNSTISGDGRFITFRSAATNYVTAPGNDGEYFQSYLRDTLTGTTKLITMDYQGAATVDGGIAYGVSDDGRTAIFTSPSKTLIPGQSAGDPEGIFLRDMVSGATTRISSTSATLAYQPKLTGDGRYALYYEDGVIKRYDVLTGDIAFASLTNASNNASQIAIESDISGNGRYVVFASGDATVIDTSGSDTNGVNDIFVRDMRLGVTTRITLNNTGFEANGSSSNAVISANGRHVAFVTTATNLIDGDSNGKADIFIRDTAANLTRLVSVTYDQKLANAGSTGADISGDGRYVVFESAASNLTVNDFNGVSDVFLRDTVDGVTVKLSVGRGGTDGNGMSSEAHISTDGRYVTFTSDATNLTAGDSNGKTNIFRISLVASEQADYLLGSYLADTISGFGGADIIKGFAGADTMDGGAGDDMFYVDRTDDKVIEATNGGDDTIVTNVSFALSATAEVELVKADPGSLAFVPAVNLTGNGFADTLIGNLAENTLDGKTGADVMQGLGGDDRYFVDQSSDVVKEAFAGGMDKVYASVGYTLKAGVEVEVLGTTNANSTANFNLVGNEYANAITGNAGVNVLTGNLGADTLNGNLGNDRLAGGGGNDTFLFNTTPNGTTNVDRISDFANVDGNNDLFQLENGKYTKLGAAGALSADAFKANTTGTATDLDDRILYKTATGELFYDADGNKAGGVAAIKFASIDNFASLTGATALSASDFFVI